MVNTIPVPRERVSSEETALAFDDGPIRVPIRGADVPGMAVFRLLTEPSATTTPTSVEALYPAPETSRSPFIVALRLLGDAAGHATVAMHLADDGDLLAADDAVQQVQALLPELFCLRSIGDGYGAVVNALIIIFDNQAGRPLAMEQLRAVRAALHTLRSRPRLSIDAAVDAVLDLEKAGLDVNPRQHGAISDLLGALGNARDDEGVR